MHNGFHVLALSCPWNLAKSCASEANKKSSIQMVMEVVYEDIGEDNTQCMNHPYRNSSPGGICAFCLQEKLGKLVSTSSVFPSSSPNLSRSAIHGDATSSSVAASALRLLSSSSTSHYRAGGFENGGHCPRKSRLPFVLTTLKKKKIKDGATAMNGSDSTAIVFKRSKSTATPTRRSNIHFPDKNYSGEGCSRRSRRGFWSFLHPSKHSTPNKGNGHFKDSNFVNIDKGEDDEFVAVDRDHQESPNDLSRSRSVGCGSRSFSGDIFGRISTGLGDCTLRRVESQREGNGNKLKVQSAQNISNSNNKNNKCHGQDCVKKIVKCGGLMVANSVEESNVNHGVMRSKSWVWAFASPMRAFGKHSNGKKDANNSNINCSNSSNKNRETTPNLSAIPSLLAVGV